MSSTKPLLALWMMVKDEASSIRSTIRSNISIFDCVVLVDTGSSDSTIEMARSACEGDVPIYVYREPFVDFATTRNRSMELAAQHAEWLLMLNGDETLSGGEEIRDYLLEADAIDAVNIEVDFGSITFRHPRITRANAKCRYEGRTHEALVGAMVFGTVPKARIVRGPEDLEKKRRQWERDEILLGEELLDNPGSPRAQFYLAQTLELLGREGAAARFYRDRAKNEDGYGPERYEALLRLATIETLDADEHLMQAIELYPQWPDAYTLLAERFWHKKLWQSCFVYSRRACELHWSEKTLFSRTRLDLLRWDLLSASSFHAKQAALGRRATLIALDKAGTEVRRIRDAFNFYHPGSSPVFGDLVLVVGTGRSGTSVVTRIISELGVDMGPDIPSDDHAPDGYGEDRHVRMFAIERNWKGLGAYLAARVENLDTLIGEHRFVVGCKSPYIAEFAEEFCDWLPDFQRVFVINCERDMDLVQQSFVRAWGDRFSGQEARQLLNKRLEGGRGIACSYDGITVHHEQLCKNPVSVVLRIAEYLRAPAELKRIKSAARLVRS